MSHHAATDRLLLRDPAKPTDTTRREIQRWQEQTGLALPASVREWFERPDALAILAECSNSDHPLPVRDMSVLRAESAAVVRFMNESQGCCRWAFRLDGADDPEVVVQFDGREWRSCGSTFSGFVEAQVFDWEGAWAEDARTLSGPWPSADVSAWLRTRFEPGPASRPYGEEQPRFFDGQMRLTIWRNWISRSDDAEWRLSARTFRDLDRMLDMLQPFYDHEL